MAPAPAAAAAPAPAATACSSSASSARPPSTASSQSPPRRTVPALLLFTSLAALLILSSGEAHDADAATGRPLKDVSLENPEVTFAPSSMGGIFCERIRISRIPRWQLQSYANQIQVRMNVSHSIPEKFHWKIQICFHGNVSTGLCQCEMGEWQVLQGGMWNAVKSPYVSRYVDVKLTDKKSTVFSLSIQEELQKWRLACLGIGFVLLFLSPIVSKWAPFYYSSSMALGILLVVLIILFQGMKLLPMGRKGFFYLTIYGSVLGVGSYAVHYFSSLVASILENFGLSEEMHNPVSIFLLVAVVLTGAGFGYWMVRRFIISKDGSVDAGIAQFVKWAMRVVAMFFVMQSTLDPILALAALAASWWICSVLTANKVHKPTAPKRKQSNVSSHPRPQVSPNTRQVQFLSPSSGAGTGRATTTQYGWNNLANGGLVPSALGKRVAPNQDEDYYSTFHNIEPRKYSKREWEEFTEESTRNALMEHTATPEFAQWAADNAHRLRVERDEVSEDESIESSSSSSEEAEKGVGSTIGAGVYVLVGTVAREHAGPALAVSFLIAGIAAALSAFCYAELASRCPSAGSAYHYSYICIGEGVAWLIGWSLVLEYTLGGSAVARGISPNLSLFFGGPDMLPWILARHQLPWFGVVVDPCAAALVLAVTVLLCLGIKESSFVQGIVTILNACVMLFVIIAGCYIGFQIGWDGYKVTGGYFPYGVNGVLAGSATVFFAYIGFDTVASTAEEVKNPQRDLPLGIGAALSICCFLYMMVAVVIVGIVPYFAMDPDTPISSAFAKHGMQWAMYVVTTGAVLALCSTLMGSLLPQPRILMAMARDGLLPSFFSDVNKQTQVPVKGTVVAGVCAAALAFFMDVSQLAGMVSVGTLLAFTIVAVSILILRYVPPEEISLSSSRRESVDSNQEYDEEKGMDPLGDEICNASQIKDLILIEHMKDPLLEKKQYTGTMNEMKRRKIAAFSIGSVCLGVLLLTSSASATWLPFLPLCIGCIVGALFLIPGLGVLCWIDQDDGRHSFGHSGGFMCPFVPFLPVVCILINTYLLINLGGDAWLRVGIWLLLGVLVYIFYGRNRSSLVDVVCVPVAKADVRRSSSGFMS